MSNIATRVVKVAEADLPTRYGSFRILVFLVGDSSAEFVALVHGSVGDGGVPMVRLHSECLTGDTLGSARCDCGEQLEKALRLISQSASGALLYLPQEGRGIGLANKIRAYALQDAGLDTVDANTALGLPVDGREYASAASVLRHLGVQRLRLLTNNPSKVRSLERQGVEVVERVSLEVHPNPVNLPYLRTKAARMGHFLTLLEEGGTLGLIGGAEIPRDGDAREWQPATPDLPTGYPFTTVHYAQTLDGRIATRTGDSQWIGGDDSLRLAHQLRAAHDVVMVGVGTVLADDPRLTVRHVPGTSPSRVVVDSRLRIPAGSHLLTDGAAPTLIATTTGAPAESVSMLRESGVEVAVLGQDDSGRVRLDSLFSYLSAKGVASVLIEGGRSLITSALRAHLVDRYVVCLSAKLVGDGIEAVGDLGISRLREALTFEDARFVRLGEDVVFDGRFRRDALGSN